MLPVVLNTILSLGAVCVIGAGTASGNRFLRHFTLTDAASDAAIQAESDACADMAVAIPELTRLPGKFNICEWSMFQIKMSYLF